MRHVVGRLIVSGAAIGFAGFLGGGIALADCTVPSPGVPAPLPTPTCVSLQSTAQNAPVQAHFPASPLAVPDTIALARTADSTLNQVFRAAAGTPTDGPPKTSSQTGTGIGGSEGADGTANGGGGTAAGGGAAAGGTVADPAAGTAVLGARVEAPVLPAPAGSETGLSMTAPTGAGQPQVRTLIAPAAQGMNGPAGLSALLIVVATATVAAAGVAQARAVQARRVDA